MPRKPITVAETLLFIRQAATIWDEGEREAFIGFIATHPDAGDIIPIPGVCGSFAGREAEAASAAGRASSIFITMPIARRIC